MSRELREHSRRSATYYSRFGVGGVAMGLLLFTVLTMGWIPDAAFGAMVFGMLRRVLMVVIWVLVPFFVCDMLSREKREGTLELLFLTPLRSGSVVMGKSLAQLVRVGCLVLAVGPVFSMVWLAGGVSGQEYLGFFLYAACGFVLSFLSGLVASAMVRRWGWAVFWAVFFSIGVRWLHHKVLADLSVAYGLAGAPLAISRPGSGMFFYSQPGLVRLWFSGGDVGFAGAWILLHGVMLVLVIVVTGLVLRLVSAFLRGGVVSGAGWVGLQRVVSCFTRPVVAKVRLRGRLRRALDTNPIGWLHQRKASTRITKWVWCLAVLLVQLYVLTSAGWDAVGTWQWILGILVGTGLMVSAAGSFRVEREEGAFELLLVTSISEGQIIWGRLRGLWAEVFPSVILLSAISVAWWLGGGPQSRWYPVNASTTSMMGSIAAGLGWLAVPVIGLHSSLRFRTFSMALAVSWFWAFGAPALASVVVMFSVSAGLNRMARGDEPMVAGIFAWVCVQLAVAGLHWAALHQGLVRREFRMGMGRWD